MRDILAVPYREAYKFRCTQYLPIAAITNQDLVKIEESGTLLYDDETTRTVADRKDIKIVDEKAFLVYNPKIKELKEKLKKATAYRPDNSLSQEQKEFIQNRVVEI